VEVRERSLSLERGGEMNFKDEMFEARARRFEVLLHKLEIGWMVEISGVRDRAGRAPETWRAALGDLDAVETSVVTKAREFMDDVRDRDRDRAEGAGQKTEDGK
jgi:hypothetical protein